MDNCIRYFLLSYNNLGIYYASEKPIFVILLMMIELEKAAAIEFDDTEIKYKSYEGEKYKTLFDILAEHELKRVEDIVNFFLRQFTFKDIKKVINEVYDYCVKNEYMFVEEAMFFRDKVEIVDAKKLMNFDNGLILARFLMQTSDKNELFTRKYKKYIKEQMFEDSYDDLMPLAHYIVDNLPLIKGHVINLVAN